LLQRIARVAVKTFYREIEIRGMSNIPSAEPVMIVANHGNSLIDPMIVFACLKRRSLYLAKSTLWEHPFGRYIVKLGPAIPVYRRHDPGVDPAQNEATFDRCHRALDAGKAIALFPEGLSHLEPSLQPMKTGTARIVLEAEKRFGPLRTTIVPVGLTFESRDRFRSRVLIEIGTPIEPSAEQEKYLETPRDAVRSLTDRIEAALRSVTLNYANWRDAELLDRAAELYAQPQPEVPRRRRLAEKFETRKELLDSYRRLRESHSAEVEAVTKSVDDYDRLLQVLGLSDAQVASSYPRHRVLRFLSRTGLLVALWLPLAAVGVVLNFLPYLLPTRVVRILKRPLVEHATYKLLSSVILFPILWILQASVIGHFLGWPWGVSALLLAPIGGYAALRFRESSSRLIEEARAYFLLATRRRTRHELLDRRQQILDRLKQLAELDGLQAD